MSMLRFSKAWLEANAFRKMSAVRRKRYVDKRLRELVEYARKNSVYYGRIIPEDWKTIDDIPITDKKTMMANFTDTCTDSRVTWDAVSKHIEEHPTSGRFLENYVIVRTSGTTGEPAVLVQDDEFMIRDNVSGGGRFVLPIATLCAPDGYGVESERYTVGQKNSAFVANNLKTINSLQPIENIVGELNAYRPKTVIGYASLMMALGDEAIKETLKIKPKRIMMTGEFVSDNDRSYMQKAFPQTDICTMYGSTEGGVVAYECKYGHLHINEHLAYVQPIDENGHTVPDGSESHALVLTNLSNRVQPLIRYLTEDRVIMHHGCPCGQTSPWIEIDGRTNDAFFFDRDDGETVRVSTSILMELIDSVSVEGLKYFSRYQLVLDVNNRLECRFVMYDGVDRDMVFGKVRDLLCRYLGDLGVTKPDIVLSDLPPQNTSARGKCNRFVITPAKKAERS